MSLSWTLTMRFRNILLTASFHSWSALWLLQTQLSVSSRKCVYGLLTSGERFQSIGARFHFWVSAQVNTEIYAPTIPYAGMVKLLPWHLQKQCMTRRERERWRIGARRHLVGYCVLVGEPMFACQVFIHRWNDLQYVVVWRQSCKREAESFQ